MIKMKVAGSPIGHSLSPLLHNHAYQTLNVAAEFTSEEVNELSFQTFITNAEILAFEDWR